MEIMGYKPLEQDYRIWLVVNPSTWLIPTLLAVLGVALMVHFYAFSLPDQGWAPAEAAVVEEAVVAEEAAPAEEAAAEEAAPAAE